MDGTEGWERWPLHEATFQNNKSVLYSLLVPLPGGDSPSTVTINDRDQHQSTALHVAALFGRSDCMDILLTYGADINGKDKKGDTPLHVAARAGHLSLVEHLVKEGANVFDTNSNGETPLMSVSRSMERGQTEGRLQCVQFLRSMVVGRSHKETTKFYFASRQGPDSDAWDQAICATLRRRGVLLNDSLGESCSPGDYAVSSMRLIEEADVFVCEMTRSSPTSGFEIGYAACASKQIVGLYRDIPGLLGPPLLFHNPLVQMVAYNSVEDIEVLLSTPTRTTPDQTIPSGIAHQQVVTRS